MTHHEQGTLMSPMRRTRCGSSSAISTIDVASVAAPSLAPAAIPPTLSATSTTLEHVRRPLSSMGSATSRRVSASQSSKVRMDAVVPDSMELTSPSRWSQPATTTEGSPSRFQQSYEREYDYTLPNVSTQVATQAIRVHKDTNAVVAQQQHQPRGLKAAHLVQQSFSGQVRRSEEEASLKQAAAQPTPREVLCRGLPYTWRDLVPFHCPILHPEIMSYDPAGYHSIVAKQTRDIGMRIVDSEACFRHRALEGLDLNMERGVTGLSLRKHVAVFRMQQLSTYPGVVPLPV